MFHIGTKRARAAMKVAGIGVGASSTCSASTVPPSVRNRQRQPWHSIAVTGVFSWIAAPASFAARASPR
jgi:hypothetical protein